MVMCRILGEVMKKSIFIVIAILMMAGTVWGQGQNFPGGSGGSSLPAGSVASTILQTGLLADCITNSTYSASTVLTCQTTTGTISCTWNSAPTTLSNGVTLTGTQDAKCPSSLNSANTLQCFVNYQATAATTAGFFYDSCVSGDGNVANNVGVGITLYTLDQNVDGSQPLSSLGNGTAQAQSVATLNGAGCLSLGLQNATADQLYINGTNLIGPLAGSSFGDQSAGFYHIGGNAVGSGSVVNTHFYGTIAEVLFYSSLLSANDIARNCDAMAKRYGAANVIPSATPNTPNGFGATDITPSSVTLGDSLTGLTSQNWSHGTALTASLDEQTAVISVDGYAGEQMYHNAYDEPYVTSPHFHPRGGWNTIQIWACTNDIGASALRTPAQCAQDMRSTAIRAMAAGWKVIVATMVSRTGTGTGGLTDDALKNQLNPLLRGCVSGGWCTYLNDYAAIPNLGADGANANATYFTDGIHQTTLPNKIYLAPYYARSVNRIKGCHDFSCARTYTSNGWTPNSFDGNAAGTDSNSASGSNSQTQLYPYNFRPGDMAFACAQWVGATVTLTVADTNTSSWNSLGVITNGTGRTHCYYAFNVTAGPDTVTFTFSGAGGTFISRAVQAYNGVNTIDQQSTATGTSTSPAAGSVTTTKNSELVIAYAGGTGIFGGLGAGPPTGYGTRITTPTCGTICTVGIADLSNVATGAINPTWAISSAAWEAGIATFYMGGTTVTQQDQDVATNLGTITANTTMNLTTATGYTGQQITFQNLNHSAFTWTLSGTNSETIDGASTKVFTTATQPICLVSVLVSASAGGKNWQTCSPATPSIAPCLLSSQAGPLACGNAQQGKVAIPNSQSTYTINTTAAYSGAVITLTPTSDNTGIPGSPACPLATLTADPSISATSAGVSFTIAETSTASITCYAWKIN